MKLDGAVLKHKIVKKDQLEGTGSQRESDNTHQEKPAPQVLE